MRFASVIIAVLTLAAAGVFEALRASKLSALQSDGTIQAKLDSIPMAFAGWTGETIPEETKSKKSIAIARLVRNYTRGGNHPTQVMVLLIAGDPGELGAHDPERCYGGIGYNAEGYRKRVTAIDGGLSHQLWTRKFNSDSPTAGSLEVAWGWTAEGPWQAAEDARYEFAGRSLLYKLYLSRRISPTDAATAEPDPTAEFLTDFAPLARIAIAGAK